MHDRAILALEAVDRRVSGQVGPRASLSPQEREATPLARLARELLTAEVPPSVGSALARELERIAETICWHFPDNIFWDLDFLGKSLLSRATESGIAEAAGRVVRLHELFGRDTPIGFRYVHDFLYGFDWAKWVRRDLPARGHVGPFSDEFLGYLEGRGSELLDLIAADDEKYPALEDAEPRNPFPFSREPAAECALHRELSRRGLIPVEAWRVDAAPSANRPYLRLREQCAEELGLMLR
jgi:hypothetical protein